MIEVATAPEQVASPWRSRDFRLVWAGSFVNDTGDWLLLVALPVFVFVESGSGSATAVLFAVELIAALVVGPLGGSLVDRWDLRRTLVATNVAQAVTLVPLLAVTGDRIWPAYVVVGAQAALRQLNNPASVALLPRLVGADQLTAANAASSTSASLARLIGSPVGGLAVGLGGIGAVVVIDAVTFLAVAAATTLVRADTSPIVHHPGDADGAGGGAVTPGVRAGLRAITEHPRLRWLLIVNSLGQVSQGFFLVLFVVFVVDRLGGGGTEVGVIRGSMAVGALVGAAVIARTAHRCDPIVLLATGYVGMGVTAFAFWNAPSLTTTFWIYPLLFGLSGVPGSALSIGSFTAVQTFSPPGALGRVVGTAGALEAVTRALGSLLAGALVDERTLTALLDVQAAVYVGCGVLAVVTLRRLDSIHR